MADIKKRSAFTKDSGSYGSGGQNSRPAGYGGGDSLEPSTNGSFSFENKGDENVFIPKANIASNLPHRIKVDLNTYLEQFFSGVGILALIAAVILLISGTCGSTSRYSHHYTPPDPAALKYIPLALIAAGAGFLCRWFTDNYYIMDTVEKRIYYHFKFFGYESVSLFLAADQIEAIGVTGKKCSSKHAVWWEYKIVIIDKPGNMTDFSDRTRDSRFEHNEKARGMAAVMQCNFAECPPEAHIKVTRDPSGHSCMVSFAGDTWSEFFSFEDSPVGLVTMAFIGFSILIVVLSFAGILR
ncbi:MAG TPA: hypothetical protein PKK26_02095 [Candidatus Wallbacteria bacterium]|nr:hypothetical protein [Candidatus Wallbacteria bacterium]